MTISTPEFAFCQTVSGQLPDSKPRRRHVLGGPEEAPPRSGTFRTPRALTIEQLQALFTRLIKRLMRLLTCQGYLVCCPTNKFIKSLE
jgi:hypothetical protein